MKKIDMSFLDALPSADSDAWTTRDSRTGMVPSLSRDDIEECATLINDVMGQITELTDIANDMNFNGQGSYEMADLLVEIDVLTQVKNALFSSFDFDDMRYVLHVVKGDIEFE